MPRVRNDGNVPHRYYLYARREYLTWAPGEVKEVPDRIAIEVCHAHPGKMVLDAPVPEEPVAESPSDVSEKDQDVAEVSANRSQRGGRTR